MPISQNIKLLRERFGITQKELAEIAGVTDKAVSTWELGTNEPRMGAIQKISDHFGIKKSLLIEDDGMLTLAKAPPLNLSEDTQEKLNTILSMVDCLTDDEWQKLMDYAALLLSARQNHKDD